MKNIAIIFGGKSCESDISVLTSISVYNALKTKYNCKLFLFRNGLFYNVKNVEKITKIKDFYKVKKMHFFDFLSKNKKFVFGKSQMPDCAVLCTHGGEGENGILQGILESRQIPYTGSGIFQSSLCIDKVLTKKYLEVLRYPVLPYRVFEEGDEITKLDNFAYPLVCKPARLGSSIGITFATDKFELSKGLMLGLQFDRKILVEKALSAKREYTCACFMDGEKVVLSDVEEIVYDNMVYSFEDKYAPTNEVKRVYPAEIPEKTRKYLERLTKKIYLSLGLRGVVRIDYLEGDGKIFVNEINTIPGSFAWYLFKNKGYDLLSITECMMREGCSVREKEDSLLTHFDGKILSVFPAKGSKATK